MTINQIILLIIVILFSIILIFGIYFLTLYFLNKKREKKIDNIFNPNNIVEEESLLNVMDKKRNVEYINTKKDEERFINTKEEVKMVSSEALSQEQKVNPFGVDLTQRNKEDGHPIEYQDPNNTNKFFK